MVDTFVGMQWGSEGKGAIVARVADHYQAAVRTGAPNAGHSIYKDNYLYKMRSVPCAWVNPHCQLYIGPGGLINPEVLSQELRTLPQDVAARLVIDRNAGVVQPEDIHEEERTAMNSKNGSTAEGIGPAQARKVLRRNGTLASALPQYASRIGDTSAMLYETLKIGGRIMLEGTQGYGLSLNHGEYPYVTSRDVLAASLLSDAGLSPKSSRYVFGVMRSYPIRVAGNSGPFGTGKELTWDEIEKRCDAPAGIIVERTTVTNRVRRVGEIDWSFMQRSVAANGPIGIFLTFVDYIDWRTHGATDTSRITTKVWDFVETVEKILAVPVVALGTGGRPDEMVWLSDYKTKFGFENKTAAGVN